MSGSAVISAVTVLENPRLEGGKGRNVLLDGHLYIEDDSSSSQHARLVLLHYFNESNHIFDEVGRYYIQANISIMDNTIPAASLSEKMESSDYVLAGNIIQLIPLPDDTSPCHRPFVNIIGVTTIFNQNTSTFELSPEVYIGLRGKRSKGTLPVCCYAPATRRWETHRPSAKIGNYIGVTGFLKSVHRDSSGMATQFQVEIEQLTYLPCPYVPLALKPLSSGPIPGSSTSLGKQLRFSYADSSPPQKKPQTGDSEAAGSHTGSLAPILPSS